MGERYAPSNFPLPRFRSGGSERENCETFIQDFLDYCTVQYWYRPTEETEFDADAAKWEDATLPEAMSTLRTAMSDEVKSLYKHNLKFASPKDSDSPKKVLRALLDYFSEAVGVLAERTTFNKMLQNEGESISDWECRCRKQGARCDYGSYEDELVRDRFIAGLNEESLQAKLINQGHKNEESKEKITLRKVVSVAKTWESANKTKLLMRQARGSADQETVNWTSNFNKAQARQPQTRGRGFRGRSRPFNRNVTNLPDSRQPRIIPQCDHCGCTPGHPREQCWVFIKKVSCNICGKVGHLAKICRSGKSANAVEDYEDQEEYSEESFDTFLLDSSIIETVNSVNKKLPRGKKNKYFVSLKLAVGKHRLFNIPMQLDTAATCNTMSLEDVISMVPKGVDVGPLIRKSRSVLHTYSNKVIKPIGEIDLMCEHENRYHVLNFQILHKADLAGKPNLLSGTDCINLGLLKMTVGTTSTAVPMSPASSPNRSNVKGNSKVQFGKLTREHILSEFKDVHKGLGRLGKPVHLKTNPKVTPIQASYHRTPLSKLKEAKQAIRNLEKLNILTKVNKPTDWCSNCIFRERPGGGDLRPCIDPSQTLNKALLIPKYPIPTLDELAPSLNKARKFSVVDVKKGFTNLVLDHESSLLTTMHTPLGRYRWLRLPYGISPAPEIYQLRQHEALEGLHGVLNIADDILITGSGESDEEASVDHDRNLWNLMLRCRMVNLKLNADKFKFKQDSLKFMGMIISKEGMKADPAKVEAINNMPEPVDKKGVQRFLGMCQYLSRFCPNLSESLRPLQELTKDDVPFIWSDVHKQAYRRSKDKIMKSCLLRYFDVNKPAVLQTDASDTGIGAALLQDGQPVAFTSSKLTATEQNYAVIEKEMLAIVVGVKHFYQYLYGKKNVTVHTDHQPLQTIFRKPLHTVPKRLQKMMLKLQDYQLNVEYKKGKFMYLADTLSRAPADSFRELSTDGAVYSVDHGEANHDNREELFRLLMEDDNLDSTGFQSNSINRLRTATQADPALSTLGTVITNGWPDSRAQLPPIVSQYWPWKSELAVHNGIIYKGHKIIIPSSMRVEMLGKIHRSHQGADSNLRRARLVMFWPGMTSQIVETAQQCGLCALYKPQLSREPMLSHPIPNNPWELISQDLFKWSGKWYMVTVDHYSDWIEVDPLENDTTATKIIEKTMHHFARFGVPFRLLTDNGPQYISYEFKKFAKTWGFEHVTRSPYHEQATGKAESGVKIAKSFLKKASLVEALLDYRNTPQQGLTYSPAQRHLCRHTRSLLPVSKDLLKPAIPDSELVKTELGKKRVDSKQNYDKRAHSEHEMLNKGDWVYTKPNPINRSEPWGYGRVVRQDAPRSYTVATPKGEVRRNRIHLRAAEPPLRYFATVSSPEDTLSDIDGPISQRTTATAAAKPVVQSTAVQDTVQTKERPKDNETVNSSKATQSHTTVAKSVPTTTRSGRMTKPKSILDL